MDFTYEQHANRARAMAQVNGMHDCIHYAPNWQGRADALYTEANAAGFIPFGIGLLVDGRMAITAERYQAGVVVGFAEPIE